MSKNNVLILGGAGFIGSNIADGFSSAGYKITVIDGLVKNTGGKLKNLEKYISTIKFIPEKVEEVKNLDKYISESDVIFDCMAWTLHLEAMNNPLYDVGPNLLSHLHFITKLKNHPGKKIIYFGSRGQYGNPKFNKITEENPLIPGDVQGIHKTATEAHFRVFSKIYNFHVISLRLSNCYGPNQILSGDDIGLVGGFIRDTFDDKTIEVYGGKRIKSVIFVQDLVEVVLRLVEKEWEGFNPINYAGNEIYIEDLVKKIQKICKRDNYIIKPMPPHISEIDLGSAVMDESKLIKMIGKIPETNIDTALNEVINYFKQNL